VKNYRWLNRRVLVAMAALLFLARPAGAVPAPPLQYGPTSFINYETPHVHPLEVTPDGTRLLAVNTAEGSLMVFSLTSGTPVLSTTIMVGVDPVTVRASSATEAWVVNRISNSVSIVDLTANAVVATLDVCHMPGDVVFAGIVPVRAVVSCTRPNRLVSLDPVARTIVGSVNIAGESPRALAVGVDEVSVYAAIFESGNPTTVLVGDTNDGRINNVTQNPAGPYGGVSPVPNNGTAFNPPMNPANPPPPPVSAIVYKTGDGYFDGAAPCNNATFGDPLFGTVKACWVLDPVTLTWTVCAQEGGTCLFLGRRQVRYGANGVWSRGRWQDDTNGDWTRIVTGSQAALSNRITNWDLPDRDVAMLNVASGQVTYQTRLMNAVMAISVNPANRQVYVVGTDATNSTRFQPILNGVFLRVNLAHFVPGQAPAIVDLNPHLTYTTPSVPPAQRGLDRGRTAPGARDQEPAHANPALGGEAAAPARRQARGRRPGPAAALGQHHREPGARDADPGQRIPRLRPAAGGADEAAGPERACRRSAGPVRPGPGQRPAAG